VLTDDKNGSEISVRFDITELVSFDKTLLIDAKRVIPLLEKRVKSV
jgi:hypothetical protein